MVSVIVSATARFSANYLHNYCTGFCTKVCTGFRIGAIFLQTDNRPRMGRIERMKTDNLYPSAV
jgi:hypothetical protein